MPDALQQSEGVCPWCGESISLLIDGSVEQQHYVEDCFVCCRPIEVTVHFDATGQAEVYLSAE